MIAAFLLLGTIVWLSIAAAAGWLAWRQTHKRWLQIAISLFVLWLPFWDVIPGLYFYYKAIREVGGVRIYRTVKAEGYLDRTLTDCRNCWTALRDSPYEYLEVEITASAAVEASLTPRPGYYVFRFLENGDPGCDDFEALSNVENLRKLYGLRDACVSVERRPEPFSRYEYSSSRGWMPFNEEISIRFIDQRWQRVSDLQAGELLAAASGLRFVSWLGAQIGIPEWRFESMPNGERIEIDPKGVVQPL